MCLTCTPELSSNAHRSTKPKERYGRRKEETSVFPWQQYHQGTLVGQLEKGTQTSLPHLHAPDLADPWASSEASSKPVKTHGCRAHSWGAHSWLCSHLLSATSSPGQRHNLVPTRRDSEQRESATSWSQHSTCWRHSGHSWPPSYDDTALPLPSSCLCPHCAPEWEKHKQGRGVRVYGRRKNSCSLCMGHNLGSSSSAPIYKRRKCNWEQITRNFLSERFMAFFFFLPQKCQEWIISLKQEQQNTCATWPL